MDVLDLWKSRQKPRYPDAQKSIGIFYRKMGRESCWEVVGPARDEFDQIAKQIKIYLEKNVEPVSSPVIWTMYMIGRSMDAARPTIMFCSKEADCRKTIRNAIEKSGILNGFPCVRVGDADRPPDFDQLVPLALLDQCPVAENSETTTCSFFSVIDHPLPDLDPTQWSFRLIEIFPREEGAIIKCRTMKFSRPRAPPYTVILGNITKSSCFTASLIIDDTLYNIPVEIVYILELLCPEKYPICIWIDQLCVDQNNVQERQNQIGILPRIRSMAIRVMWPWDIQSEYSKRNVIYQRTNDASNDIVACKYSKDCFTLWKATMGGAFRAEDKTYRTTISHGFPRTFEPVQNICPGIGWLYTGEKDGQNDEHNDFEYDIQDADTEPDDELMDSTSIGSLTPEVMRSIHSNETMASTESPSNESEIESEGISNSQVTSERIMCKAATAEKAVTSQYGKDGRFLNNTSGTQDEIRNVSFEPLRIHLEPIGKFVHFGTYNPSLDYTLIEIDSPTSRTFNEITFHTNWKTTILYPQDIVEEPIEIGVFAVTGSTGVMTGRLLKTPTFMQVPHTRISQEIWTVRLDGELQPGDSGSMVVDANNGKILGHIVSASPKQGIAYILPMYQILNDIKERLNIDLKVATRDTTKAKEVEFQSMNKNKMPKKNSLEKFQISRATQTTLSIAPNSGTDSVNISALLWGTSHHRTRAMDNLSTQSTYVGSSSLSRITMAEDIETVSSTEAIGNQKPEEAKSFSQRVASMFSRTLHLKHRLSSLPVPSKVSQRTRAVIYSTLLTQ